MFHLMTHAFFKGCLFLCAGSVIHAMSGEQDIRRMGGLRKKLPYTYTTFLVATLAIAGVPGLSGFFSKDEILWRAFTHVNAAVPWWSTVVFPISLVAAFGTAFYMFRLLFVAFFGEETRADHEVVHHIHESPKTMTMPLVALAALSAVGGFLGLPALTGLPNLLEHGLEPVFAASAGALAFRELGHGAEAGVMAVSVALAGLGIFLAWKVYGRGRVEGAAPLVARIRRLHSLVLHKYYVDEAYQAAVVRPFFGLTSALNRLDAGVVDGAVNLAGTLTRAFCRLDGWIDAHLVDGLVNAVANATQALGARLRRVQTGLLQDSIYLLVSGLLLLVVVVRVVQRLLG
jgi:NADH-quinone oxidoreductase subunit L